MQKYHIPTAEYKEISNKSDALNYIETCQYPIVLKKDGLAAGKGVIIAENWRKLKQRFIHCIHKSLVQLSLSNFRR